MPTAAHFVFIPAVLLIGIVLGFVLGTRSAKDEAAERNQRAAEREKRRAERKSKSPS